MSKKEPEDAQEYSKELQRLYARFNRHFWKNALPREGVFFTITPSKKAYGHFTPRHTWVDSEGGAPARYEINIDAYTIDRPPYEFCATLLHEMCHLSCHIQGIQDTSNGAAYHNSRFKHEAEDHGLIVTRRDGYHGWTDTSLSDEAKKYCDKLNVKKFTYHRDVDPTHTNPLVKYYCPKCGACSCWVSTPQVLKCGHCDSVLVPSEKYRDKYPQFFD